MIALTFDACGGRGGSSREPLFELANHGTRHRPLSVTGRSAYGIDVAARIVAAMGDRLVTFSVNSDGRATFTPDQVRSTVAAAVPRLTAAGYRFVRLSDELPAEELPS